MSLVIGVSALFTERDGMGMERRTVAERPGAGVGLARSVARPRRHVAEAARPRTDQPGRARRGADLLASRFARLRVDEPDHPVARRRHRRALPVRTEMRRPARAGVRRSRQGACSQPPRTRDPGLGRPAAEVVPAAAKAAKRSAQSRAGWRTHACRYAATPSHTRIPQAVLQPEDSPCHTSQDWRQRWARKPLMTTG
jgi:hypothetical protein